MTLHEALRWASSFLEQRSLEQPVAEWLLRHYLQIDRAQLLMRLHDPVSDELLTRLKQDLARHVEGIPVQHLIGYEEFYGRRFTVNSDVLIPRPETEELVQTVLGLKASYFADRRVTVADIGTGSGAIAITLAMEDPKLNLYAVDISEAALTVAKKNATELGASVSFLHGDLLEPLFERELRMDIVVSNPPYIPLAEEEELAVHVKEHEPHLALFGGDDGLVLYRRMVSRLPAVVKDEAIIAFEVGVGQAEAVREMLQQAFPIAETEIRRDINGKERIVLAYGQLR
ncbi:peptide chain release factor N(5)-glutamine methyltransferase [Alkalihalobacillus oceani]|uniref:peptide chain release factor N(5)-glutamine methyltransferase n=1 Tax=Halalkalibacter oceani TaxID=1653776 RepID=UPI00203D879C|nr:peptide chain release factor N(5)-glutamine methyltransferase [Halalkalibacter oceani]MCM3760072.1 peptide chain release factor N(5)-glutamine methyltransferase [Halalkalibacter oceani]